MEDLLYCFHAGVDSLYYLQAGSAPILLPCRGRSRDYITSMQGRIRGGTTMGHCSGRSSPIQILSRSDIADVAAQYLHTCKYFLQFELIQLVNWKNTVCNLDKYSLKFWQIYFAIQILSYSDIIHNSTAHFCEHLSPLKFIPCTGCGVNCDVPTARRQRGIRPPPISNGLYFWYLFVICMSV